MCANIRKKKILVILGNMTDFGGGFQYILSIINALDKVDSTQVQFYYIVLNQKWEKYIKVDKENIIYYNESILNKINRKIFYLNDGFIKVWRTISRKIHSLYSLIENIAPDLVIFPSEIHYSLGTKRSSLVPIHDLMHRYEPKFLEVGNKNEFKRREFTYRNVCKFSKGVLVDSELGKKQLIDSYGIKEENIYVLPFTIPNYICETMGRYSFEYLKAKYNLPDGYIFYPASLWSHKNHINILIAMYKLKQRHFEVNAVFCGGKRNYAEKFLQAIKYYQLDKNVTYIDYIPNEELAGLYENAVALIFPSYFGPTNIPPLEAFACGCPVASSDVYAMREQLGDAALFFNPDNIEEISGIIYQIWTNDNLRKELIAKGYERFKTCKVDSFNNKFNDVIINLSQKK